MTVNDNDIQQTSDTESSVAEEIPHSRLADDANPTLNSRKRKRPITNDGRCWCVDRKRVKLTPPAELKRDERAKSASRQPRYHRIFVPSHLRRRPRERAAEAAGPKAKEPGYPFPNLKNLAKTLKIFSRPKGQPRPRKASYDRRHGGPKFTIYEDETATEGPADNSFHFDYDVGDARVYGPSFTTLNARGGRTPNNLINGQQELIDNGTRADENTNGRFRAEEEEPAVIGADTVVFRAPTIQRRQQSQEGPIRNIRVPFQEFYCIFLSPGGVRLPPISKERLQTLRMMR